MINWDNEKAPKGVNNCGYCTGSPPSATCTGACFQESYTKDWEKNREDQIKRKAHYHKWKLMQYEFDKQNWASFHDALFDATYDEDSGSGKSFTQDELEVLFMELPELLQYEAFKWGMNDTPWREDVYEWYQENKM